MSAFHPNLPSGIDPLQTLGRRSFRRIVLVAFLPMSTKHFVRLPNKSLRLRDALAQLALTRFNLTSLLFPPLGSFQLIGHGCLRILCRLERRARSICFLSSRSVPTEPLQSEHVTTASSPPSGNANRFPPQASQARSIRIR